MAVRFCQNVQFHTFFSRNHVAVTGPVLDAGAGDGEGEVGGPGDRHEWKRQQQRGGRQDHQGGQAQADAFGYDRQRAGLQRKESQEVQRRRQPQQER